MKNYPHLEVDLTNCDKEPIHIIGRIQTHGFLLILDRESKLIQQVSQNIEAFTGIRAAECLNAPLATLFAEETLQAIDAALEAGTPLAPFPVQVQGRQFMVFPHESSDRLLLELEPTEPHSLASLQRLNVFLATALQALSQKETLAELSAVAADKIQQVLDYDRVMIYQFDADWHGHVVAEKVKAGVKSYYNHHFPASDIPEQAREMLLKKGIRQIVDVDSESIAILPYLHPLSDQPTDVSGTELRNPSEIHLEYLRNMAVGASVSISIVVKGKLWGLVCCQHQSARLIDYYARNTAWLITQFYASAILSAKEKQDKEKQQKYAAVEKVLVEQLEEQLNIREGLFAKRVSLLDLTEATGAALVLEGKIMTLGQCPSQQQIQGLVKWASQQELPEVYCTRQLSKQYPSAFAFKHLASGLMLLEISRHNQEYLMYFKREVQEIISWAGNPDKSLARDGQHRLHPRQSFEKWEQAIEGKSSPWSSLEAERARSLVKTIISIQLKCQAERLRELNMELQATLGQLAAKNAQLEDFAHIASHNLFAPLNNIQGLLNLYHREPDFATAQVALDKIKVVSVNMRQTLEELHQLLKITQSQQLPQEVLDLEQLIARESESLSSQIQETAARIHTELQVPTLCYSRVYLESILHNLLSNAVKYRSPERKPVISIKTWQENNQILLQVADNGLGIDVKKHSHRLFGLYKTFHTHPEARGIGLYLVKKQVEALGGTIQVESQLGQGTRFTVHLPQGGHQAAKQISETLEGGQQARGT